MHKISKLIYCEVLIFQMRDFFFYVIGPLNVSNSTTTEIERKKKLQISKLGTIPYTVTPILFGSFTLIYFGMEDEE